MAKTFAMIFGYVFVLVGILGFFSNQIVGRAPGALFAADTVHNLVHLVSGIIFLWVAYSAPMKAGAVMKIFGVVYLLVALLGFLTISGTGSLLGIMLTNTADNWLHVVLGIVILGAGLKAGKSMMSTPAAM
jgi:hypothetical protein